MIELRTFGHTELTAGEDGDADALIAQSKRFALFCYLALPKPGILHRRDTLLGVFWPETDQEHSRLDLRQALAFIRKTLGEDVLLRRGDHEVGLNPDIVWCDAAAFQQAVEQREWAEAVELYQGDFLKGFFLSNEAEFEPWLDGERARLAGAYRTALEEAANSAVSDGHGRRAVEYCERLVEQDRYNSRYAMKLMEALAAVGDPANALLCAERHAELLQEEFDIAPPPELQALAEQIRQESATVPLAGRGQSAEEVLPPSAAPDSPSATVKLTGARQLHTPKRGWKVALATGAVAAVLAATVTVTVYSRESSTALDPSRVAVAVFRHATGDPSLDHVGERAAHWITQGLQQAAIQVTPWDGALQAWQYVQSEAEAGRVSEPVRAFAAETGAGTVVSGAVYLENDSLEIHVNVTDAIRGRPAGTVAPVRGSRVSVRQVIADVQQRVMGFFAVASDERFAAQATDVVQPPSYESYRAFDDGVAQYYRHQWSEALPYFYRAFELDSTFVAAFVYAILQHVNLGEYAKADSLIGILGHQRDRLSEYDLNWLDYLAALVHGDSEEALRAIRRAADVAPGSRAWFNRAHAALWLNRPQEAIDALSKLDPERGQMRGWRVYFNILIESYLRLERLEEALRAAQKQREIYGDNRFTLYVEAVAQAANRRIEEVNTLVDELATLPEPKLGHIMTRVAVRLRLFGYNERARSVISRTLQWYDAAPPEEKLSWEWRERYSWALYVADRCDEAYNIARSLSDESPEVVMFQGLLGMVAACRGNREEALTISERLQMLDRPYLREIHTAWRSLIAGALGDGENAVALWKQAVAQGIMAVPTPSYPRYQIWIAFESLRAKQLRDYPPFQELIRPKG